MTEEGLRRAWDCIGAAVAAELAARPGVSIVGYLRGTGVVGA